MTTATSAPPRFRELDDYGAMAIHSVTALEPDEQVEGQEWFVESPGQFRIYFADLTEADDWVWWQQQTELAPAEMDHGELAEGYYADGLYQDLRSREQS